MHGHEVAAAREARAMHRVPRPCVHHEEVGGVAVPRGDVVDGRELGGVERRVGDSLHARERLHLLARGVGHGRVVGGGRDARVAALAHAPPVRLVVPPLALQEHSCLSERKRDIWLRCHLSRLRDVRRGPRERRRVDRERNRVDREREREI